MNEKISDSQLRAFILSFLLSNTLTVSGSLETKEKFGYITVFISYFIFFLLIKMYDKIFKKANTNDFYKVLEKNFPKKIYNFLLIIIFVFSFIFGCLSSANIIFFVTISSVGKINIYLMGLLLCLCLFGIITKRKQVLWRYCSVTVFGILFLFFVMLVFGIFKGDFENLFVTSKINPKEILSSTFFNFLSPFSDIFLVYLFLSRCCNYKRISKYAKLSGIVSAVVLSGVYLLNLTVLGKNLMSEVYYPTLFSFGIINPVNKISRSEIIYYSSQLFFDIIYTAVSLFVCKESFFKLFENKKETKKSKRKEYVFLLILLSFILLYIFISSFSGKLYNFYPKIAFLRIPLNIGLILILFIKSKIKANSFPKN